MRGKLVILLMVLIGCAMGGLSVAYHHWLGRRAIAWWGSDNVELITHAPRVEVLRFTKSLSENRRGLSPFVKSSEQKGSVPLSAGGSRIGSKTDESDSAKTVTINGVSYPVEQRRDVTATNGMDHLRHGLLEDGNFSWTDPSQPSTAPTWAFGLEFIDGSRRLTVVFDRGQHIGRLDGTQTLSIAPVATGWKEFFAEQFPAAGVGHQEVGAKHLAL